MKTNFIETIESKKDLLINSYVKQYGEEYRERITDKINDLKFVFYINSEGKKYTPMFVCEKLEIITTFKFLERLGASEEELRRDEGTDELKFLDSKVNNLMMAFFNDTVFNSIDSFRCENLGIYSFLVDTEDFSILSERMRVFKKLGIIDIPEKDYYEFSKSEYYEYLVKFYRKIAVIADDYAEMISYRVNVIKDIYNDIYNKNLLSKIGYMKDMVFELRDLLPLNGREFVENNPDFEVNEFLYWDVLCDSDCLEDTFDTFGIGLLEVFSEEYDNILLDEDSLEENIEIVLWRNKYLRSMGIDIAEDAEYSETKKAMEENKDLLPKKSVIKRITECREKYEELYLKAAGTNMVIEANTSTIFPDDVEIMLEIFTGAFCSSLPCNDEIKSTIFIDPLTSYKSMDMDHLIDHEIRHAIESSIYYNGSILENKCGNRIETMDENYECYEEKLFDHFNEVFTDKLSIKACQDRWLNGEFIFSPQVYREREFGWYDGGSTYSDWLPNLEILLKDNFDELLKTRMDLTSDAFYKLLSFIEWNDVDRLIPIDTEESKEKLKAYALKINANIRKN